MKNNIKEIEVKIEKEEFEKALENTLEKKLQNFQMDGFRKGKVPKDLYLKKYGKESLYIDAVDSLLPSAYEKALKDVNKTYEFYDRYREIIVSKKVAQVIRENVPDVEFYPVFKRSKGYPENV